MIEEEALQTQSKELFLLEKLLSEEKLSLSEMEYILPAYFHVNSIEDSTLIYCSQKACDFLQIEKEELMPYSAEQLASFVTEDTLKHITPRFVDFYQENDHHKVFASFQQLQRRGKEDYSWVYTTTKIYKKLNVPISLTIPIAQMGELAKQISGLLEDNLFIKKNFEKFASLSKREREIIQLLVKGTSRKDIAEQLYISIYTYDTHRRNIRKKLGIRSTRELMKYATAFGLL